MIPNNDLHSKIPICIWNIFNWFVMWAAKYTPSQISNLMNNDNKTKKEISIRIISYLKVNYLANMENEIWINTWITIKFLPLHI